jgi:hypothetical protein
MRPFGFGPPSLSYARESTEDVLDIPVLEMPGVRADCPGYPNLVFSGFLEGYNISQYTRPSLVLPRRDTSEEFLDVSWKTCVKAPGVRTDCP